MYIYIINFLSLYLAFFSKCKSTRKGFKTFSFFLFLEYFLFKTLQSGFHFNLLFFEIKSTFSLLRWSFTEHYSIYTIECLLLSFLVLKFYGWKRSFLFVTYNFTLAYIYLNNIYRVNVLKDEALWNTIYNYQWAIGVLSVLFLIDHRLIYGRFKHFINYCRNKLGITWTYLGMDNFAKKREL